MTDQMKEKVIREVFDSFDTNGDNSISMTELKAAVEKFENRKITDVELNKMVKEMNIDQNGDGKICFDEFRVMVHKMNV